jgi:hypothetical protein
MGEPPPFVLALARAIAAEAAEQGIDIKCEIEVGEVEPVAAMPGGPPVPSADDLPYNEAVCVLCVFVCAVFCILLLFLVMF